MTSKIPSIRSPWLGGLLSTILPGLGQMLQRRFYRGIAILIGTAAVVLIVAWNGKPIWYLAPAGIWLWNIWDAVSLAVGRPKGLLLPVLFGLIAAYGIGIQVVHLDLRSADFNRALLIARPFLHPDFIEPRSEKLSGWVEVQVPCGPEPPPSTHVTGNITVTVLPNCAAVGDTLIVTASGLWPDVDTNIWFQTQIGDPKMLGGNEDQMLVVKSDDTGSMTTVTHVPSTTLVSAPDPTIPLTHRVYVDQSRPIGGMQISENGRYVLNGMVETLALAFMATVLSVIVAVPVSFLAARNLMSANPLTFTIYVVVRTILNIVRSIEALIVAIIFVVIVGLGPFAGVMALAIHSVAALAKLYSEVIEGIDPGPIEAIRATGANWVQVVRYSVIPQIIPPFTSFTIYRWDINVRSSTIIGFVGGGGIGFYLIQWIQINDLRAVSAAFIAIAVVVVALDYLSARIRERLV